jgi:glycerophosphoryl diester phosphodiesterase
MSRRFELPSFMGHRGAAALAPENTLPGLDAAANAGCGWVEVDVMLSKDGVPVLHHDHSLRRTAGDDRQLSKLTAEELGRLDVGGHFGPAFAGTPIPTLAEALARMAELGLTPNLELKPAPGTEKKTTEAAIEVLRAHWPDNLPTPMLSSFRRGCLETALRRQPDALRALIAEHVPDDWHRLLDTLDCVALNVSKNHLTVHRAEAIRGAGYGLGIYTVNNPVDAQKFRRWGADCIITDAPDKIAEALSRPLLPVGSDRSVT